MSKVLPEPGKLPDIEVDPRALRHLADAQVGVELDTGDMVLNLAERLEVPLRERNVLLVSPTSLIGLLRTMELGWLQEKMVAEAQEIADAAGTLHARFAKFLSDFEKVGKGLTSAATAYDSAVGSMERRLLPQLRKVEGLGVAAGKEIEPPEPTLITVRAISAPELREASEPELAEAADPEPAKAAERADAA